MVQSSRRPRLGKTRVYQQEYIVRLRGNGGAEDIPEYHPGPKVNGFEEGIRAGQNRDLVDFV